MKQINKKDKVRGGIPVITTAILHHCFDSTFVSLRAIEIGPTEEGDNKNRIPVARQRSFSRNKVGSLCRYKITLNLL